VVVAAAARVAAPAIAAAAAAQRDAGEAAAAAARAAAAAEAAEARMVLEAQKLRQQRKEMYAAHPCAAGPAESLQLPAATAADAQTRPTFISVRDVYATDVRDIYAADAADAPLMASNADLSSHLGALRREGWDGEGAAALNEAVAAAAAQHQHAQSAATHQRALEATAGSMRDALVRELSALVGQTVRAEMGALRQREGTSAAQAHAEVEAMTAAAAQEVLMVEGIVGTETMRDGPDPEGSDGPGGTSSAGEGDGKNGGGDVEMTREFEFECGPSDQPLPSPSPVKKAGGVRDGDVPRSPPPPPIPVPRTLKLAPKRAKALPPPRPSPVWEDHEGDNTEDGYSDSGEVPNDLSPEDSEEEDDSAGRKRDRVFTAAAVLTADSNSAASVEGERAAEEEEGDGDDDALNEYSFPVHTAFSKSGRGATAANMASTYSWEDGTVPDPRRVLLGNSTDIVAAGYSTDIFASMDEANALAAQVRTLNPEACIPYP